tara:strand:+ start:1741 stop:3462 length:1722 start_codon:yes stop_codon:yes gene_type:complete
MIEIFLFSFVTSICYISAGIFFAKKILDIKITNEENIYKFGLYGGIFLAFLGLFLNFFISLGKNINTFILIIFLIYLIITQKKIILKKVLISSIIIGIACSILLIFENTYRPDSGLYHLPFISTLNNEKIIIGLSNIHFRYGHTSIVQYLSALNNNWIFSDNGIVLPSAIIYISFLLYLINEIQNIKNKYLLLFNFLLISFLCLKLNRYSDFGNDAPAHIYYFFLTSLALKNFHNLNKINMGEIITLSAYIVFNKITLFLGSFVAAIFLIVKKKIFYFKIKPIIFVSLFTFVFFLKNFLISGCLAFPIEKTCAANAFWYDMGDKKRDSIAKITMIENEAWTKGWSDQKKNVKNYEEYLSDYSWVKIWFKNHGKRTFYKLTPFLIFVIFLTIIILINKNKPQPNNEKNIRFSEKNFFYLFLLLNFAGVFLWFIKFPVFRYGYSYIILSIIFLIIICLYNKIKLVDIQNLKKKFNYFLIFLIFILVTKNFLRIVKNYGNDYNYAPWPKIYSEDKKNDKKQNIPIIINNEAIFYYSNQGTCYYSSSPCTHLSNSRINKNTIKFKSKLGYKIFYFVR